MDQNLFDKGLAQRKATLGADYVENNLAAAARFHSSVSRGHEDMVLGFRLGRSGS